MHQYCMVPTKSQDSSILNTDKVYTASCLHCLKLLLPLGYWFALAVGVPKWHSLGLCIHQAMWCIHQLRIFHIPASLGLLLNWVPPFSMHSSPIFVLGPSNLLNCSFNALISVRARISWFSLDGTCHSLSLIISMYWFSVYVINSSALMDPPSLYSYFFNLM